MKFTRNNIIEEIKAMAKSVAQVDTAKDEIPVVQPVVETQINPPTERVEVKSELAERFAIPAFESSINSKIVGQDNAVKFVANDVDCSFVETRVDGVGACCPNDAITVTEPVITAQNVVAVCESETGVAEDTAVKKDDLFVPIDEKIHEAVQENVAETQEQIVDNGEVVKEENAENKCDSTANNTTEFSNEAWEKFVDNVIIPTLVTCTEKVTDYIKIIVAAELKNVKPDVK